MKRRLIMFFICCLSLIVIVNISRTIYRLWQKGHIVEERQSYLTDLKQKHSQLEVKLGEVQSPQYIERQAREKLNLQREGEVVVVLPQTKTEEAVTLQVKTEANWQKWWKLFF